MQNVSEQEALALMALPKICDDIGDWTPVSTQAGSVHLVAGVLRPDGVSARLQVDLDYRVGRKTGLRRFKLSCFIDNTTDWKGSTSGV